MLVRLGLVGQFPEFVSLILPTPKADLLLKLGNRTLLSNEKDRVNSLRTSLDQKRAPLHLHHYSWSKEEDLIPLAYCGL